MKELDKKILLQLLKDADRPIVEIAEEVGATRQTVSKKIKKFKEDELIDDSMDVLDPERLGLSVRAFVFLQEDPEIEIREKDEEEINNYSQVSNFFRLFGRYSGLLEVWTESRDELTDFVKKIHDLDGIKETETFIVHSKVKDKMEEPFINILKKNIES